MAGFVMMSIEAILMYYYPGRKGLCDTRVDSVRSEFYARYTLIMHNHAHVHTLRTCAQTMATRHTYFTLCHRALCQSMDMMLAIAVRL